MYVLASSNILSYSVSSISVSVPSSLIFFYTGGHVLKKTLYLVSFYPGFNKSEKLIQAFPKIGLSSSAGAPPFPPLGGGAFLLPAASASFATGGSFINLTQHPFSCFTNSSNSTKLYPTLLQIDFPTFVSPII
jgi:hypothetical protein